MTGTASNTGDMPLRIFVFDSLRTRSHLLFRWLLTHPSMRPVYHPYLWARYLGAERHTKHLQNSDLAIKESEVDMLPLYGNDTCDSCSLALGSQMAEIEAQGKVFVSNEHIINILKHDLPMAILRDQPYDTPRNPTYIPDVIYNTLSPIVLIRNPIIHITSLHRDLLNDTQIRPGDESFTLTTSFAFTRHLYDQLREQGRNPILVDAEDLLWRTQPIGEKLCAALRIENVLSEKWEPTPEDQRPTHPMVAQWTKDIHESNGILRPAMKPAEPNLQIAFEEWTEKFGIEVAQQLSERVKANIPHYDYLTQFKI